MTRRRRIAIARARTRRPERVRLVKVMGPTYYSGELLEMERKLRDIYAQPLRDAMDDDALMPHPHFLTSRRVPPGDLYIMPGVNPKRFRL
jgi:hypothetical protein